MRNKYTFAFFLIVCSFTLAALTVKGQVVINEFSASNLTQYVDNHSDFNDWIELYNSSGTTVNLAGYYLSDDSTNNTKWQMPVATSITANGYLRFWASGRNEVVGTSYHTNFTLKQTKNNHEYVVLSNPAGVIVDIIEIAQKTKLNHSYGRTTNGASTWSVFTNPTPNASNNTATPYVGYTDKPDFSLAAGFYPFNVVVTITTTEPNSTIRYTTDGSVPTATSPVYTTAIPITATTVLKAITFSSTPTILSSFVRFNTYFIGVTHTLPVVSIAATQLPDLANDVNSSLQPQGTFEFFNTGGQRTATTYGEFNRHGQDSWANSQRSLDFISRDEMGYNHSVEEVLFNTSARDNYQRVILRAAGDDNFPADYSPQNAGSAHVRDAFIHNTAIQAGLDVDARRGSKCIVYLNGQYWGVYDLRDNPDDHDNTEYYYGQDKFNLHYIETWGNTWAQYGGTAALTEWSNLRTYILTHSMAVPANYQYVTDRLDVKSIVDYVAVNMFTVCSDWLNWNTAWWRGLDSTGTHLKWGYALWDNDATYGHYINYTHIPNTNFDADPCDPETITGGNDPEDHIAILLALRQNPGFNQYYITRMLDLWNTTFSCDNLLPKFDSTVALITPEMPAHCTRWAGLYSDWQNNVTSLRNYIIARCASLQTGFMTCYNLTGPYDVTVTADPITAGTVQFNSLALTNLPWTGTYFGNINNNLVATPNANYNFVNWTATTQTVNPPTAASASVMLTNSDTIVAHFLTLSVDDLSSSQPGITASPSVFNSETTLQYSLPEAATVSMKLYSLQGTELATIIQPGDKKSKGTYAVKLDLSGTHLSTGMYVVNFVAGNYKKSVKLVYNP